MTDQTIDQMTDQTEERLENVEDVYVEVDGSVLELEISQLFGDDCEYFENGGDGFDETFMQLGDTPIEYDENGLLAEPMERMEADAEVEVVAEGEKVAESEVKDDSLARLKLSCTFCQKQFSRQSVKSHHDKIYHSEYLKVFKCNHCEHESLEECNILKHYSTVHKDIDAPSKQQIRFELIKNTPECK